MWSRTSSGRGLGFGSATQQAQLKVLELFHSLPENQICADCGARLSDSIWASVTLGAFLCIQCAGVHRMLGVQTSRVKSLQLDAWSDDDVVAMRGGNKHVSEVYEKYMDKWIAVDDENAVVGPNAAASRRERHIQAKYNDMKFTRMPVTVSAVEEEELEQKGADTPEESESPRTSVGEVSRAEVVAPPQSAAQSATDATANADSDAIAIANASEGSENQSRSPKTKEPVENYERHDREMVVPRTVVEVSKRLMNYFVVIGKGGLAPDQCFEKTNGPTDIEIVPSVIDQYPDEFKDSPLPSHIAQFAFPEGFALTTTYSAPTFFSFVLTNVSGVKIYACALRFYEEMHPLEIVSLLAPHNRRQQQCPATRGDQSMPSLNGQFAGNNQNAELPKWVHDLSGKSGISPGPVFCPKCIVVTSHYPFYCAYRQFLQQIYRVILSDAPMPLERYVANFMCEIPLPPPGRIQVQLTLPDRNLIISRPPHNDFPLADHSFRPLFQMLDVGNVLLVFACVMLEFKVALVSKHIAVLTPTAETILTLLLPFAWQGAYIPVLPASLVDVLDAPVPFLIGMHADSMTTAAEQVCGVVFVDLDHNRINPGIDENGEAIVLPRLPEREGAKLRAKLTHFANIFDPFAAGLSKVDLAFPNDEHLIPIGDFASERGHTVPLPKSNPPEVIAAEPSPPISAMGRFMRGRKTSGVSSSGQPTSSSPVTGSSSRNGQPAISPCRMSYTTVQLMTSTTTPLSSISEGSGLSDSGFNEGEGFSTIGIRKAFLRFFVTILKKYASYLNVSDASKAQPTGVLFDSESFLRDHCDTVSRPFLSQLVATQMFDRFVQDRVLNQRLPEVQFFDQSINQKLNRSITLGKKKFDCTFLEDRTDEIRETFIAPPPSNLGLPDDGTVYKYKSFPRLKRSLFGNVRKPRELYSTREQQRNILNVDLHQRIFTMTRRASTSITSWETTRRLIIHLQSQYRMYIARRNYTRLRNAVILLQRWTAARMKGYSSRQHYVCCRTATITIQSYARMLLQQRCYQKQRVAILMMQCICRSFVGATRYRRAKNGTCRLQAQWRSRVQRRTYQHVKRHIIRMQSLVRGLLSRKQTKRWREELFEVYRRKIFDLWEQCDVPLLHRSKFWLTFNQADYFNLGIFMEEERRMQAYFKETHVAQDACASSTRDVFNDDPAPHKGLREKLKRLRKPKQSEEEKYLKRDETARRSIDNVALARIEEERQQLYETLKHKTSIYVRSAFYQQFGIPLDAKKKKRHLAKVVWTSYGEAAISSEVVVTVSCFSDRYHPLPAQIDRQKQSRIRDDLAFTINAALKSIRYESSREAAVVHPMQRNLDALQHQVRVLTAQNRQLTEQLATARRQLARSPNEPNDRRRDPRQHPK